MSDAFAGLKFDLEKLFGWKGGLFVISGIDRAGEDLTVIAYGLMLHYALEAAEAVAADGIGVEVLDLRTLVPLDKGTILDSVRKTNKVLIVHEDTRTGGFGGELAAVIAEEAFEHLDGPVRRLTGPDVPAMPFNKTLEQAFMQMTGDSVEYHAHEEIVAVTDVNLSTPSSTEVAAGPKEDN